jgi:hypothetical protein
MPPSPTGRMPVPLFIHVLTGRIGARHTSILAACYRTIAEYGDPNTVPQKFDCGPGLDEPICLMNRADGNAAYYCDGDRLGSGVALLAMNTPYSRCTYRVGSSCPSAGKDWRNEVLIKRFRAGAAGGDRPGL